MIEKKGSTIKDKAAALFSKIGASEEAQNQSTLPKTKVFVQGLPFNCKQQELKKMFEDECGSVKAVNLIKFDDSERCKGMAYITFDTESGAAKSLEMTGKKIGDRWLNVAYEKPRLPGSVKKGPRYWKRGKTFALPEMPFAVKPRKRSVGLMTLSAARLPTANETLICPGRKEDSIG